MAKKSDVETIMAAMNARDAAAQEAAAKREGQAQKMALASGALNAGTKFVGGASNTVVKVGVGAGKVVTQNGFIFYLILALLFHLTDWGLGFTRPKSFLQLNYFFYMHLAMAVITWVLFFFRPAELKESLNAQMLSLIFLFGVAYSAYIFPMIGGLIPNARYTPVLNVIFQPMIHPIWVYLSLLIFKDNKLANLLRYVIVLFWAFYFLSSLFIGSDIFGYSTITPGQYATIREMGKQYVAGVRMFATSIGEGVSKAIGSWFQASIAHATGTYYTGEAEQAKPIGIIIDSMEGFPTQFPVNKPVVINAVIKAMDGVEETIMVKDTSCWSEQPNTKATQPGDSSPKKLAVFPNSEQRLRCNMAQKLGTGGYSMHFAATYGLQSRATLNTYFADFGKNYEAQSQGMDLLESFPNREDVTTYTNGPVMVGIGLAGSVPITVVDTKSAFCTAAETSMLCDSQKDLMPTLGITLRNRAGWEGEVTTVSSIKIDLPLGLGLDLNAETHGGTCDFALDTSKNAITSIAGAVVASDTEGTQQEQTCSGGTCQTTGTSTTATGGVYYLTLKPELGGPVTKTIALEADDIFNLGSREYTVRFGETDAGKYQMNITTKSFKESFEVEEGRTYRIRGLEVEIVSTANTIQYKMGIPLSSTDYNAFQCDLIPDHDKLLGESPVAPRSIIVDLNYNFVTEKDMDITVTQ